jgi:cytochrome c-type biogenesis protein CcmH/NrfG
MNTTSHGPSGLAFILDQARTFAFGTYLAEHWPETEILLEGILAADPTDAWSLSVYASMLRKQGKLAQAAALIDRAHQLAPADANITAIRDELARAARRAAARTA